MLKNKINHINIISFLTLYLFLLTGCSSYIWHVQNGYLGLLTSKISIREALENEDLSVEEKNKLKMISELKHFAQNQLNLDIDKDAYTDYIPLDRPYVTYLLRVSDIYELRSYKWDVPIVGIVPYLGFFDKELAQEEAQKFPKNEYDTHIRGVSAFSTLGWFDDLVFSSMLAYKEHSFVNTIFHELAHSVLFFEDHVSFNERFAEFVGRKSTEAFYIFKEGSNSPTVQMLNQQWHDQLLFSKFISKELKLLNQWYKNNKGQLTKELKDKKIKAIQTKFTITLQPLLKTKLYDSFPQRSFNNASLLPYRTYNYNMEEFEKLYNWLDQDIEKFIEYCEEFEDEDNPEEALSQAIAQLT